MKAILTLIGILVVLAGVLPFLKELGFLTGSLEAIPTTGMWYQVLIIAIGVIAFYLGVKKARSDKVGN